MPVIPESEIEGPISAANPDGPDARLVVVGVTVRVPAGTPIKTPTKAMTVTELLDPTPFPGRAQPGFVGGTAIVEGDFDTGTLVLTATAVEVEPAENLLLGGLTSVAPLAVNGVRVEMLPAAEPRLPGDPPMNEFGFAAVLNAAVVDKPAAADGYFDGAVFRAYHLEVDGGADLVSALPQLSILRADFRERDAADGRGDEFDLRGAVTMDHAPAGVTQQQVEVFRLDGGTATSLGTTIATRDADFPRFGTWRHRGATPVTGDATLDASPPRVRATNLSPGANNASAEKDTDIQG